LDEFFYQKLEGVFMLLIIFELARDYLEKGTQTPPAQFVIVRIKTVCPLLERIVPVVR
jgi:hypothetical protein